MIESSDQAISHIVAKYGDLSKINLNKLPREEIELLKKHMDRDFYMLRPGDEGYEYDKEVEFEDPEESNE